MKKKDKLRKEYYEFIQKNAQIQRIKHARTVWVRSLLLPLTHQAFNIIEIFHINTTKACEIFNFQL